MAEDRKPSQFSGDSWTHAPLPYKVVLRMVLDMDRPAERVEVGVVAYSMMEAVLAAIYKQCGTAEASYRVESVEPDLAAYVARKLAEAAHAG